MSQYTLQSLNTKTNAVTKKALLSNGKSNIKAQFGTQYLVVDNDTGRAPKKQILKKKGKDLIVEVDGEQIALIRDFYQDSEGKVAPTYRVDDYCSLDDAKSLEDSDREGKYELVVGGTAEGSAHASGDGVVWHEDAAKCIIPPTDPIEAATAASSGLSQNQMIAMGLGALLIGGGAVAIAVGSGGSGSSTQTTPPPSTPQLISVYDDIVGGVHNANLSNAGLTNDNRPTLTFTAAPGCTVKVYDGTTLLGTAVEGPAGTYTLIPTTDLADGLHSFTATATNAGGTSAPTSPFTLNIDATAPALQLTRVADDVPGIVGNLASADLTNDNRPTLTFTAEPGSTVQVYDNGVLLGTAVEGPAGTYTLTPASALADGQHSFTATATDVSGNTSAPTAPFTLNIDATAPALQLTRVADDVPGIVGNLASADLTNDNCPTLTFTAEPGSTVQVYDNGVLLGTAVEGPAGTYTLTPASALADGQHSFTATATDVSGNTSAPTAPFTLTIDTLGGGSLPGLNIPDAPHGVSNTEAANGVELVITIPADATVGDIVTSVVTDPNGRVITLTHALLATDLPPAQGGTATGNGPFTITQTVPLSDLKPGTTYLDGTWHTRTTVGDLAGNVGPAQTGSFNLAANAPSLTLNTIAGDNFVNAVEKQGAVAISGNTSAEPGQTVTITVVGPNSTSLTYYAAVQPGGSFSTDIPAAIMAGLQDGSYTLTANVSNAAGTPAVAASKTLALDTVAPLISITAVAGSDNVFSPSERGFDSVNYTLSNSVPIPPTISGTTDAAPGQSVTVTLDGQSYIATVIAGGGSGNQPNRWSVQIGQDAAKALVNGSTYPVTASVSDAAGNQSLPITPVDLLVNIATPDVPTVVQNLSGTTTPTLTGNAQKVSGAQTLPLGNGDTLTITVAEVTITAVIDSAATNGTTNPAVTYDFTSHTWSLNTATATGIGANGATVGIVLTNGTYPVGVAITVSGSQVARPDISTNELIVNTTPPVITLDPVSGGTINAAEHNQSVTITGTTNAQVGSTVTITGINGQTYNAVVQAGVNGASNTFSVQVPGTVVAAIADGTLTLNASVTNAFGLTGTDSKNVLIDTTAPSAPAVLLPESPNGVNAAEVLSNAGTQLVINLPANAVEGDIVKTVVTKPDGTVYLIPSYQLTQADITAGSITQTIPTAQLNVDGTWTTSTTITDAAGNKSLPGLGSFNLDTQAPGTPTVLLPEAADILVNSAEATSNGGTPVVTTLPANAQVGDIVTTIVTKPNGTTLSLTSVLTAADIVNGTVSQLITTGELSVNGTWTTSTTVSDPAGNSSSAFTGSFKLDTTAPASPTVQLNPDSDTGSSSTDGITKDNTPLLSGNGVAGDIITIYNSLGQVLGTTTVNDDNTWSFQYPATLNGSALAPLPDGIASFSVTATDPAGNTSAPASLNIVVDTSESAPTINPTNGFGSITGTGNPGASVTLIDTTTGLTIGNAVVSSNGTWSITPSTSPANGRQLSATQTDPAGNISNPTSVTVDSSVPYIAPTNGSIVTGTAAPNTTINLYDTTGGTPSLIASGITVDANGNWVYDPALNPSNPAIVNAEKLTPQSSTGVMGNQVIVDNSPPSVSAILFSDSNSGNQSDLITNDTTPTVIGVTDPGAVVHVTFPGGQVVTVIADGSGNYSATPTNPISSGTVSVTATDITGNTTPTPATLALVIDAAIAAPSGGLDHASTSDTGTSSTDNLTKNTLPVLSGTAEANATISVVVDGHTYTTSANSLGAWSVQVTNPLSNGLKTLTITATDIAGNTVTVPGTPFTVDTTRPAAPVINPTNGAVITGTGEPGATVTLTYGSTTLTEIVGADGTWAITPATPPADGTTLTATQTDPAGNPSVSNDTKNVNTAYPDAPVITQANGSNISGTGEPVASITLTLADGTPLRDANGAPLVVTVDSLGKWTAPLGAALPDGSIVKATQVANFNSATITAFDTEIVDAMPPAAPAALIEPASDTGTSSTDGITQDTTPTITGTGAAPGDTIIVKFPGGLELSATVATDGTWSVTPSPSQALANGTTGNVQITAKDAAGNVSAPTLLPLTIDTSIANPTGGLASSSDTGITGDNKTSDNTPSLSGTAEKGATVEVTVNGVTYTTTADPVTGAWSIPATDTLANGSYTPSIKVTDAAGNTVTTAGTAFTVDASAPNTPALTSAWDDVSGGAYNASSTNNLTSGGITNDAKPTLTGTAEPNSTVTIYDGSNLLGTVATNGSGNWTFTPANNLSDGAHSFTATATDAAGNTSGATTPFTATIDTLAPSAPGDLAVPENTNGGVNAAEVISGGGVPVNVPLTTDGSTPVQAGDVITLTVDDPTTNTPITISYVITAADITNRAASVLVPTANIPVDGTYIVSAVITDPAGNSSSPSNGSFEVDKTPPAGTGALSATSDTLNGTAQDDLTSDNTPVLSGTAEAGSAVEVTINGQTYLIDPALSSQPGVTYNSSTGAWTLDLQTAIPVGANAPAAALIDGSYTPSIKVSDAAGNSTTSSGTAFTVDASAPEVAGDLATASDSSGTLANVAVGNHTDNITNDTTPAFTGTGEVGNVITLVLANGTYKTTVDSTGHWIIDTGSVTSGTFVSGSTNTYATFSSGSGLDLALPNSGTNVDNSKDFDVTVTATDAAGNSASVTIPVTIDTIVTDPTINPTNGVGAITGTGEAGASVILYKSDALASTSSTISANSLVISSTPNAQGLYEFTYTLTAALANNHVLTTSKPRDVVITSASGATTVTGTITATAYTNMVATPISIFDSTQIGDVVSVAPNGSWSVSLGNTVYPNGTTFTASSVDLAGNIDPPGVAVVNTDLSRPVINPTNGTLVTGTGNPGDIITLKNSVGDVIGTATVQTNGTWSIDPPVDLDNGTQLVATASYDSDPGTGVTMVDRTQTAAGIVDALPPAAGTGGLADVSDSGVPGDQITNDNTPALSGSGAEPNAKVEVTVNGVTYTTTADSQGNWTIPATSVLPVDSTTGTATYTPVIKVTDAAGNATIVNGQPFTVDTQGPSAVSAQAPDMTDATDTGLYNTDNTTANSKPGFIIGTFPSDAVSAVLYVDGVAVPATYDANTGTLTPNRPLSNGSHDISYGFVDAAGNAGTASPTLAIVIDTLPIAASLNAPDMTTATDSGSSSTDNLTNFTTPGFDIGSLPSDAVKVLLLIDGVVVEATASTDSTGNRILTPVTPLIEGAHQISYQYVDLAGNVSSASPSLTINVDITPPVTPLNAPDMTAATDTGTSNTDNLTKETTPTFTVPTGQAGVTLLVDGREVQATYNPITGEITPNDPIPPGAHAISFKTVDVAGNVSAESPSLTINIDTTEPAVPVITSVSDNVAGGVFNGNLTHNGVTNDTTPTITLTAVPGSTVKVYDGSTLLGEAIEDPAHPGTFTFTPTSALSEGTHSFTAKATDAAGNTSGASTSFVTTIDITPPAPPNVATLNTMDTKPTITGTATLVTGEKLTVSVNGATYTINPAATSQPNDGITYNSGTGAWSIDTGTAVPTSGTLGAFPDASYPVTAIVTDVAGNTASDSTTNELVINTTALRVALTSTYATVSAGNYTTNDTTPVITGTVSGAGNLSTTPVVVDVVVNGTTIQYSVLPDTQGHFTIDTGTASPTSGTFPTNLTNATLAVTAKVTNPTGTVNTSSENIIIDTAAPTITITSISGDSVGASDNGTFDLTERGFDSVTYQPSSTTVATPPVISGTTDAPAGQTVTVTLNGKSYTPTVIAGASGQPNSWSVDIGSDDAKLLNHGSTYSITASVKDLAGNLGTDTNNGLTVNIAPPDVPTVVSQVTGSTTPTITGVAMKLDTSSTATPLPGIVLTNGDSFTVALKSADGLTTLGSYRYTLGTTPVIENYDATSGWVTSTVDLNYNTTTGDWSLAVPAGVLTAPSSAPLTYNVVVSTTASSVTRTDISSGELIIVGQPVVTAINEAWLTSSAGGAVLNVAESGDGTVVRVNFALTGAQVGQVVKVQWDAANSGGAGVESPMLTAADITNGYIDIVVPKSVLIAATVPGTGTTARETLPVTPSVLSGPAGSTVTTGAAVNATVDFVVPAAPIISASAWNASANSNLNGIPEAVFDKNTSTFITTAAASDGKLYYSEFWDGGTGTTPGTVVRIQIPPAATASFPGGTHVGDTLTMHWGSQNWEVPTRLTQANITAGYVDVTVPANVIALAGYGNITVSADITSATSGNVSGTKPVTVNVVYDQPLYNLPEQAGLFIDGRAVGEQTGMAITQLGDVNGDGYDDLGISGQLPSGIQAAYVVFGGSNIGHVDLSNFSNPNNTQGFEIRAPGSLWQTWSYNNNTSWKIPFLNVGVGQSGGGDINGDGLMDIVVSSPDSLRNATYVIYGRTSGGVIQLTEINASGVSSNGFTIARDKTQAESIKFVPDINGDGIDDIFIQNVEPFYLDTFNTQINPNAQNTVQNSIDTNGLPWATTQLVVYGRSSWTNVDTVHYSSWAVTDGFRAPSTLASVGDINGDGYNDMVFTNGNVVYGGTTPGGGLNAANMPNVGFTISGLPTVYMSGGIGDVNGDGFKDILVFNSQSGYQHVQGGASNRWWNDVYLVYGNAANANINVASVLDTTDQTQGIHIKTNDSGSGYAGIFNGASIVGDINGDGFDDMLISLSGYAVDGIDRGESFVVFGRPTGTFTYSGGADGGPAYYSVTNMSVTDGFRINGACLGDGAGLKVTAAGDVNGDGFADLFISAPGADPHGVTGAGTSYVLYGGNSNYVPTIFQLSNGDAIGTSASESLTGNTGNNQIVAGDGNDVLIGNGGADVLYGGRGNDTIVINADNITKLQRNSGNTSQNIARVDGGSGVDTLKLASDVSGANLDLSSIVDLALKNVEVFDVNGGGANTFTVRLTDVLQSSGQNIFNTSNGYVPVAGQVPAGWGAINANNQIKVDGGNDDFLKIVDGGFTIIGSVTETATGNVYRVYQSATTNAQILASSNLRVPPVVDLSVNEIVGGLNLGEAQSTDTGASAAGTFIRVKLTDTGALAGQSINLRYGSQTVSAGLDSTAISNGYVDVLVPTSTLTTVTGTGTANNVTITADLVSGSTTLTSSKSVTASVNFITPTAPIISLAAWTASGVSDVAGVGEAKYAADATTMVTTGTVDNALYVSEVYQNGTVIRVQLPMTATSVASRPVAGDTLVITWGNQTYEVPVALSATDINNTYRDVTIPYSVISTQAFGSVNVTAQIKSAASGNLSAASPAATINWKFDVPAGQIATGNGQYGFTINGEAASDYASSVANAGDVNGDGFDDLIIGAPLSDPNGLANAGRAYVVFGGSQGYSNFDLSQLTAAGNSKGFVINGPIAGAFYGFAVAGGGDINGDGLADIVVGNDIGYGSAGGGVRPLEGVSSAGGPSYVIFGRTGTAPVNLNDLNNANNPASNGFVLSGTNTGWSVTNAGDMNGDGLDDIAVTNPNYNNRAGIAYVVYGKTSGTPANLTNMAVSDGFIVNGGVVDNSVAALSTVSSGDINGDGLSDLIVGAWYSGTGTGSVFVVYGNSNNTVSHNLDLSSLSSGTSTNGFRIQGKPSSYAGISLAGVSDINGDGLDDVLLQSTTSKAGTAPNPGVAWVAFGKTDSAGINVAAIEGGTGGFAINVGIANNPYGAYTVANAGDINGDGLADILVTDAYNGTTGITGAGSAYVVFGKTNTNTVQVSNLAATEGFRITGYCSNEYLGITATGAGDINGDGFDDIVVGASGGDPGSPVRTDAGKLYVIYGGNSAYTQSVVDFMGDSTDNILNGVTVNGVRTSTNNTNEQFIGGDGKDLMYGGGGADVMYGGRGNDTFILNADNVAKLALTGSSQNIMRVDGGTGVDVISLDGSGITLDLTAIRPGVIKGVEQIDISGSGNNTLKLTLTDVLDMGQNNVFNINASAVDTRKQLMITGDSGDHVVLTDLTGWTKQSGAYIPSQNGPTYDVYDHNTANVQLLVDQLATLSSS